MRSRWAGGLPKSVARTAKVEHSGSFDKYGHRAGRPVGIAYEYADSSKVMPKAEGFRAVRMKSGERGWFAEGGSGLFVSEKTYQNALRGVDRAEGSDFFEAAWEGMTPEQRSRFVEKSGEIDWDNIWKLEYDPNTGLLTPKAVDIIDELMNYALHGDE